MRRNTFHERSSCEPTKQVVGQQTGEEAAGRRGRGQRRARPLGHSDLQPLGGPWFSSEGDELRVLSGCRGGP